MDRSRYNKLHTSTFGWGYRSVSDNDLEANSQGTNIPSKSLDVVKN